jgi:hypothetical protein
LQKTAISVPSILNLTGSGFLIAFGPDFRHHNPYFRGDAESLMAAMEENARKNPDKLDQEASA